MDSNELNETTGPAFNDPLGKPCLDLNYDTVPDETYRDLVDATKAKLRAQKKDK